STALFYCPGQDNSNWTFESQGGLWDDAVPTNDRVNAGYQYFPVTEFGPTFAVQVKWRIYDLTSEDMVLHDLAHNINNLSHGDTWNRLFADGSVASIRSGDAFDLVEGSGPINEHPQYQPVRALLERP
ncbi:MAG: hypothetical protein AAFX76_01200, partial [Planctomycetota bacterium]